MKKKILFISSWFPNKLDLTAGNFVQRHAEAVAELHDVEVLHAAPSPQQRKTFIVEDCLVNGIRTLVVYYRSTPYPLLNFMRRMYAYSKGFSLIRKPDLVHANVLHNSMFFAVYLKKRFSIPFVVTEHWTALRTVNKSLTPWSIRNTAKLIGNQASVLLPVSADLAEGLKNIGIKTPMRVVPNVVDTSQFHPSEKDDIFTFIHVSNLIPRKNPEKILKVALKLLDQGYKFRLQIGGDGDISKLLEMVNNSKFRDYIEIFGMQAGSIVAERMRSSDCFILFSDDENQPCVIAESFASGIRVISTDVGGIKEFFPEDFGILLSSVNEEQLSAAMVKVMSNNDVSRKDLALYADQVFSRQKITEAFNKVYEKVLL